MIKKEMGGEDTCKIVQEPFTSPQTTRPGSVTIVQRDTKPNVYDIFC
jgi:hypothetical protein